jgi:hypothetical protein
MPTLDARTERAITELKSAYVWSVNQAIEGGSTELAYELADAYQREANDIIAAPGRLAGHPAAA